MARLYWNLGLTYVSATKDSNTGGIKCLLQILHEYDTFVLGKRYSESEN
jgi:hypothetical protein